MKQYWIKFGFALLFCLVLTSDVRADQEADHAELRKIKAAYEEAVNNNSPDTIAPFLSTNVTGVMVTGEQVKGFEGLRGYWEKIKALIGDGGTYRVKVIPEKTEFYGDLAVSRGTTEDVVRLGNGKELQFTSAWTAVCQKENGAWKVLRLQGSMDPVNNAFVAGRVQMTRMIYGLGGLGTGLALLVISGVLRKKSPSPAP